MSGSPHALLSLSGAHRWLNCPGSVALGAGIVEKTSDFAREGTAAHALAALCLDKRRPPATTFVGSFLEGVEVSGDMAEYVQQYVDLVLQLADGHELMVEQRVPIGHVTGEAGAEGTSDAIIVTADGTELIVIDLKFGRGVAVSAEANDQGQLYALGALEIVTLLGYAPRRVRIVIHQPRLQSAPSEWACTVEDLRRYSQRVKVRAAYAIEVLRGEAPGTPIDHLRPGDKQCRFCKAKAICPKLAELVAATAGADFTDLTQTELAVDVDPEVLARCLTKVDLIEDWCDAVRKHAHADLAAGNLVPGFKLVQGKRGPRAWVSEAEAEAAMKAMRLKHAQLYTYKVISPTHAERLLAKDSPRRWRSLAKFISQSEGRPAVAPVSDLRPALVVTPIADDFTRVVATCDDLV
ncbi:MAG TPA: DUF2800 domain-containing protein [Accumulibacter sp.]|uniref:DUF2800 domain-containing protein n=1 Tax=Accumulibacter sp. TaxID=2053492 RepID=UPI002CD8A94A|nr:DUF2800 domain-containing protein [Accumulibacter sp.]HRD88787.1 DUF2800 domain-containing protein [Accumulibacter sp.]